VVAIRRARMHQHMLNGQDEPAADDVRRYSSEAAAATGGGKHRPPGLALGDHKRSAEESGGQVPSHRSSGHSSSRKWHETGIESKRTVHVIATPMEGLAGIQREIENPAHPSARSRSSWKDVIKDGVKQRVSKGPVSQSSRSGSQSSRSGTHSGSFMSEDSEEEREREAALKKDNKKMCFFIPWPDYKDLPDLPRTNWLNMNRHHKVRIRCTRLALNPIFENLLVCVSVLHVLITVPDFEGGASGGPGVLGCTADDPTTAETNERCVRSTRTARCVRARIYARALARLYVLNVLTWGFNVCKFFLCLQGVQSAAT
jgi:hypothetical protein